MTRVDIRLVSERRKVIRLASKVSYKDSTIFDKNLIAIHIQPSRLMSSIVGHTHTHHQEGQVCVTLNTI